jgi:hypothetical protein
VSNFSDGLGLILAAFDRREIRYYIGGSIASSSFGFMRATNDVDIVVDFEGVDLGDLASELGPKFYFELEDARRAIERGRMFNLIHYDSAYKFDLIPLGREPLATMAMARRHHHELRLPGLGGIEAALASPEDTILAKLIWYRKSGESSDRQWNDVLGVIQVQDVSLDTGYLEARAAEQGMLDLWKRAQSEVSARRTGE